MTVPKLTALEEELLRFLKEIPSRLDRIEETQDRLFGLFQRQDEGHRAVVNELRGEMRGLNLRLCEVERGHTLLGEKTRILEKNVDDHNEAIDEAVALSRDKATEEATFLKRNALSILATLIAVLASVYQLVAKR